MEKQYLGQILRNNEIFPIYVSRNSNISINFYDEAGNILAQILPPYNFQLTNEYREMPPEFLSQIKSLWTDILKNNTSLEKRHELLKKYADVLKIDKKHILSTSSAALSQKNKSKKSHDDEDENEISKNISIREETSLNKRVDDRYTLGEILGIDDPNASLVCVETADVSNTKFSSKFSFLIKYSDGRLEVPEMLEQRDGIHPDRNVYASNRDGSEATKENVLALYRINTEKGRNSMISVSYGNMGHLKLQFGKTDLVQGHDFVAVPLETETTRFTTRQVQDILDREHGIHRPSDAVEEAHMYDKYNCFGNENSTMTADNIDGKREAERK